MTIPNNVYNPDVPQQKNIFSSSQLDFLTNFSTLYNAFSVDHVALDASSNAGNHNVIHLLEQSPDNQFQTDVGEISIYCKPVPDQGDQLFIRYQGNQDEFRLSAYQLYSLNVIDQNGILQTPYFTYLPGRVLVYFGTIQCTLSQAGIPLTLRPPIATNIITMNFCLLGTQPGFPPDVVLSTPNNNGFFNTILLKNSIPFGTQPKQTFFYIILANI